MTTPLFMLRAFDLGLRMDDLDELTIGMVTDMATERANDDVKYDQMADQDDFDRF